MRRSLKVSRGLQLLGALSLVAGIVACSQRSDPQAMSFAFILGFVCIVGGKVYEWMTKE